MIKRGVIVAVAVISALSLIAGISSNNGGNLNKNHKPEVKNKTEVIEKCETKEKKKEKVPVKIHLTDSVNDEQKEQRKAEDSKPEESKKVIPESIKSSQNLFYPVKHKINYPEQKTFGKYYDYALDVYDYALEGTPVGELTFDNFDDLKLFRKNIEETVFNDSGVPSLENFSLSYTIKTAENSRLKPANIGHKEFKELEEAEYFILNIFGDKGVNDLSLIENVNSWLKSNTSYDYNFRDISYSELGIIKNRSAVCDGYSDFVKKVCDMYGVPCEKVIGNVDEGLHAWNRVKIGGTWYYLDTTWNVCLNSNEYYLSKTLWSDHRLQ